MRKGQYTENVNNIKSVIKSNDIISKDGEIIDVHDSVFENISMDIANYIEYENEVKVATKEQQKLMSKINQDDEFKEYIKANYGSFYFYFYKRLLDKIEPQYLTRFLYLCTYANYKNKLIEDNKTRAIPINENELQILLGLSRMETYRTKTALLNNNLIFINNNVVEINPKYCKKGEIMKNKNIEKTRVFNNAIRELYENSLPREHKKLALLFQMLPYINLKWNIVCKDITEEIRENVEPYSIKELMLLLNQTNVTRFKNDLLNLTVGGESVVLIQLANNNNCITINPKIYYKGTQLDDLKYIEDHIAMLSNNKCEVNVNDK